MTIVATGTDDLPSNVLIDPDFTVSFDRPPVGRWVRFGARARSGPPGMGSAESSLWDAERQIGGAAQNLAVELSP